MDTQDISSASFVLPEHMDRWSRNRRLYETLKGMGLFVSPIPEPDDPTKIRQMIVSADLPPAVAGVGRPMQGTKVEKAISPVVRDGSNVVDFPTIL